MGSGDYTDSETLRRLYYGDGLSLPQIAERFDVDPSTIHYHMDKHDLPRRDPGDEKPPSMRTNTNGYECVTSECQGRSYTVRIHRLQAVAEFGFDAVSGKDVHHRNNIPWDNRVENFELWSRSDHMTHHMNEEERAEKLSEWGRKGALEANK